MNEGKKDRRDPIRTVKPRNFVAKNMTTGGAGAHKDKKKAAKQGETKHKNKEYAEGLQTKLNVALAEEFTSPEYNDEAGMAYGSLHTLKRAVDGLMNTIESHDDLPEWCQEKISLAEDYLVTVWDYIQSEKEQGINPHVSESRVDEKSVSKAQFRTMAAVAHNPEFAKKVGIKPSVGKEFHKADKKQDYKKLPAKKKTKEGWTHDTLADQLFEHERSYEDKLSNMLNKKLGK